jgi:transposase-like protein
MHAYAAPMAPPFCPNEECDFHCAAMGWRCKRAGFYEREQAPRRIQRYRCCHCGRYFSDQTFSTTYWLKRADLLEPILHGIVAGSAFRQLGRSLSVSPSTLATHAARLGRHCLLFHERTRPKGPVQEPLALDSFQSFEHSQYTPTLYHLLMGKDSHFCHGFTDSELRRSGRMSKHQKKHRARLEEEFGRPDPRSVEKEVAALMGIVLPQAQELTLHTDEHQDYPRALKNLPHLQIQHRTISSRAARTRHNPLFALNLMDLLLRHSLANHRRETIAFAKRRACAAERLWVMVVWRNHMKWVSERNHGETAAMKAGVASRRLGPRQLLARRLFPRRVGLPERWEKYYDRRLVTRRIPKGTTHHAKYAY